MIIIIITIIEIIIILVVDNDDNTNNNNIITNYGENTDTVITRNDHDGGDSNVEREEDKDEDSGNCYLK